MGESWTTVKYSKTLRGILINAEERSCPVLWSLCTRTIQSSPKLSNLHDDENTPAITAVHVEWHSEAVMLDVI